MDTFNQVLAVIIGPVVGILVYILIERKRNAKTKAEDANEADAMLDDVSYIQQMKHLYGNVGNAFWKQYDILLATQHYGWETMVDWAAYMESADFDKIDSIAVANPTDDEGIELAHVYNQNKVGLKNIEWLKEEYGILSMAGHSRTLNDSVKIVWYNQTNTLRLFTHINDEVLVTKYVETLIRRTFGTKDAMKLAKPVAQGDV